MLAPTKKRHTDERHVLVVSCPGSRLPDVVKFLEKEGCDVNDATPDEPCLPVEAVSPNRVPATHLRGYRYRDDLTQAELSRLSGIPRRHISEMENGRRPVGKLNARKLADVFKTDPRLFLSV